ncbi:hypothetical protein N8I74_07775 [Chitiniphilus purpureus]|uniref:Alpha/beta hydrolase n=1 Tax=Chitiniphilus purpureus TaxID=2981137 RepID=A0ABY6DYI5_9NEIS|nr:hypothetical protein [Chitiniphilus sp. CD1]UXY16903.1 hypothetical protein N8I74_07775 [Chitiniphilus sp. CD1]
MTLPDWGALRGVGLLLVLALTACAAEKEPAARPGRGTLLNTPAPPQVLRRIEFDAHMRARGLLPLYGTARCDVRYTRIEYRTVDARREAGTASAALMVPSGRDHACRGAHPAVLQARDEAARRDGDLADVHDTLVGFEAAAAFAAHGYVVVVPNYPGGADPTSQYPPYLHARAQADDVIDGLAAAHAALTRDSVFGPVALSGALFLYGYGQGGYVALAAQRALESGAVVPWRLAGAMPAAGPYALPEYVRDLMARPGPANALLARLAAGYAAVYHDEGFQPQHMLASRDPIAQGTPDASAEGAWSAPGRGADALHRVLEHNRLLTWSPRAPLALCGARQDRVVDWRNTERAVAYFAGRGVPVTAYDLEDAASLPDDAWGRVLYRQSVARRTEAGGPDGYHAALAPLCAALARYYFDRLLRA